MVAFRLHFAVLAFALLATVAGSGCVASGGGGGSGSGSGSSTADGLAGDGTTTTDAGAAADSATGSDSAADGQPIADGKMAGDSADALPASDAADAWGVDVPAVADSAADTATSPDTATNPDTETNPDTGTSLDTATAPDTDPPVDSASGPEVGPDSLTDTVDAVDTKTDVKADTTVDSDGGTTPDIAFTCSGSGTIKGLLACGVGPIDFTLVKVTVTYLGPKGFAVYDGSTNRGMLFYFDLAWPVTKPKVGDLVTVHCSEYGVFQGQQEVLAADNLVTVGVGDALATAIDVGTATKAQLGEEAESRLLVGKGLVIKQFSGSDGIVTLAQAGDFTLRVDGLSTLCGGATFDIKSALLTQFGANHRIHLLNGSADLGTVDVSTCTAAAAFDQSNWGFEEADPTDPPPDFLKVGAALVAKRTTEQFHAGKAAAQLTWTSPDNQDLVAGQFVPVVVGQKATVSLWMLDNDPAGRGRVSLTFYKADKTAVVSSQFSATYSSDSPTWVQLNYSYTVPAEAAFVRVFVRLYDHTGWAGTATVYVDDFAVGVQ